MTAATSAPALAVGEKRGKWEVIALVPRKEGVKARMVRVRCTSCNVAEVEIAQSEILSGRRLGGCKKCFLNNIRRGRRP